MRRIAWLAAGLIAGSIPLTGLAQVAPADAGVDAPALVKEAKQSQDWLAKVKSFHVTFETEMINPSDVAANPPGQAAVGPHGPTTQAGVAVGRAVPQSHTGSIELAFDQKRLYQAGRIVAGSTPRVLIWDGKLLVENQERENTYDFSDSPNALTRAFMASVIWGRNGQAYWWRPTPDDFMGPAEQYSLTGRERYHGIYCLVLTRGQSRTEVRIGATDHRLYGIKRGNTSAWFFTDYTEVAAGCWYPLTQGTDNINGNAAGPAQMRVMRATEVEIDQPLPDELFKPVLKDGVLIHDTRGGVSRDYAYKASAAP